MPAGAAAISDVSHRYRAVIEYDGTAYYGFQRQRQPNTVQERLEQAIRLLSNQAVAVLGAGRTDSGVHALGQVIAFDLSWRHGVGALQRAMNAHLPADIAARRLEIVRDDFHPRYDALSRTYQYHLYNGKIRSPLRRQTSWHVSRPLDVEAMNRAAAHLVGVHDFAAFGRPPQGDNSVRQVFQAHWRRQDEELLFTIQANAFLYRMVRSLVGSLKEVGEGSWSVESFVQIFQAADRRRIAQVAPPQGLFLVSVEYDE